MRMRSVQFDSFGSFLGFQPPLLKPEIDFLALDGEVWKRLRYCVPESK